MSCELLPLRRVCQEGAPESQGWTLDFSNFGDRYGNVPNAMSKSYEPRDESQYGSGRTENRESGIKFVPDGDESKDLSS